MSTSNSKTQITEILSVRGFPEQIQTSSTFTEQILETAQEHKSHLYINVQINPHNTIYKNASTSHAGKGLERAGAALLGEGSVWDDVFCQCVYQYLLGGGTEDESRLFILVSRERTMQEAPSEPQV